MRPTGGLGMRHPDGSARPGKTVEGRCSRLGSGMRTVKRPPRVEASRRRGRVVSRRETARSRRDCPRSDRRELDRRRLWGFRPRERKRSGIPARVRACERRSSIGESFGVADRRGSQAEDTDDRPSGGFSSFGEGSPSGRSVSRRARARAEPRCHRSGSTNRWSLGASGEAGSKPAGSQESIPVPVGKGQTCPSQGRAAIGREIEGGRWGRSNVEGGSSGAPWREDRLSP